MAGRQSGLVFGNVGLPGDEFLSDRNGLLVLAGGQVGASVSVAEDAQVTVAAGQGILWICGGFGFSCDQPLSDFDGLLEFGGGFLGLARSAKKVPRLEWLAASPF